MKTFAGFCLCLAAFALGLHGQTADLKCNNHGDSSHPRYCEMRETTVPAVSKLTVDGNQNGGITIKGAKRSDILVREKIEGWSDSTEADAKNNAAQVVVHTAGGTVSADGPSTGKWAVSYEIFVPENIALSLNTRNGGIGLTNVSGSIDFHAVNGGVSLKGVGGEIRGQTTNGGVSVTLAGSRWNGSGMDIETQNGGVNVKVPDTFSAQLEVSTVNGGMHVGLPHAQVQNNSHNLNITLGSGGPLVRIRTHNGGVNVSSLAASV